MPQQKPYQVCELWMAVSAADSNTRAAFKYFILFIYKRSEFKEIQKSISFSFKMLNGRA